ncbi:hypothetical protein BCR43DRAFT_413929, partial [Syncephalastrum racemosum]
DQLPYHYKNEYAFIRLFGKLVERYYNHVFLHYPTTSSTTLKPLTYGQVDHIATNVACELASDVKHMGTNSVVGYIGDHGLDAVIIMLAFLKLRITFMFMSPRNSLAAHTNLLQKTNAACVFSSKKYGDIADEAAKECEHDCFSKAIPAIDVDTILRKPRNSQADSILDQNFSHEDIEKIAMIIHSSGSTNYPKPIRFSNRYLICIIQSLNLNAANSNPSMLPTDEDIALPSLPLFHAFGFYCCFGQITFGASCIVLKDLPPQPHEILTICRQLRVSLMMLPPLILGQLKKHLDMTKDFAPLANIKYVIYGGASLNQEVGDFFHQNGVNVGSNFGCTEMGVFSSKDLDPADHNSVCIRPIAPMVPYVIWEPVDDHGPTAYHLVIRGDCPALATGVANRSNGDFATSDILRHEPTKEGKDYWRHLGRKDDILVMENGEKTNPIPMENTIRSYPVVKQCTVIGEARHCTAVLIELEFNAAVHMTLQDAIDQVLEAVRAANVDAPNHSTILPQMVYILPLSQHLATTAKGTVVRKLSIDKFKDVIENMYQSFLDGADRSKKAARSDQQVAMQWGTESIEAFLRQSASQVLNKDMRELDIHTSLFDYGLNSLISIQLRNMVTERFAGVPSNIIYEYPTISSLARVLATLRDGQVPNDADIIENHYQETQNIKNQYIARAKRDFGVCKHTALAKLQDQHTVLLTGATGSLGSFLLRDMLKSPNVKKVVALVRGNHVQLFDRLVEAFRNRRLDVSLLYDSHGTRLEVLPMDLEALNFGWDAATYDRLKSEVTIVQACAWLLDFHQPVSHFEKVCIRGLYNLLKFAYRETDPMIMHTISSVSAVAGRSGDYVQETQVEDDPHVALPMGYGQSKYIVEHLFNYLTREKNFPCVVERMGQVCGDTVNGVWNTSEQYPLMIVGGSMMNKLPKLQTTIDWLPVDYASSSILQIMLKTTSMPASEFYDRVYHIVNPQVTTWDAVLLSLRNCGLEFEMVDLAEWISYLSNQPKNPAYKLTSFYERNSSMSFAMPLFETKLTVHEAPALKSAPLFDTALLQRQLSYWQDVKFFLP